MPSITFDLETITPLFLSGADQKVAELRPPAFRGALRYWFRAIAGGITSASAMQTWENKVFGSTDSGGLVVIRVQAQQLTSGNALTEKKDEYPGLNYLFFSMFRSGSRPPKGYFNSSTNFKIILQTRLSTEESLSYLTLAAGAMWLLVNLGGVGARSNRGAGSLKCRRVGIKGIDLDCPSFSLNAIDTNTLAAELKDGITKIRRLYTDIFGKSSVSETQLLSFDLLSNKTSQVYIWQPSIEEDTEEWSYILDNLGTQYQDFRRRYKNATQDDYPRVKEWIRSKGNSNIETVKRAAFGLPIQFYFTSLPKPNNKASLEATQKIDRSSSPLRFKVCQLKDQSFAVVIIHFKTNLLPDNSQLRLKGKFSNGSKFESRNTSISIPDQTIINEFIESLENPISMEL
jgi:CRISPR-associated protein Cmr1